MSKIFVTGANGKTGRRLIKRLVAKGLDVLEGLRHASTPFDWENPETWTACLRQVSAAYIAYQPDLAVPQALEAIKSFVHKAKACGVKHLVLLSGRGEKEAQLCENEVIQSGLEYNIIRASWFMENFSENFLLEDILREEMVLPEIKAKEPFVSAEDITDVATVLLTTNQHKNKVFSLTGPELLSFGACIEEINAATGKNVRLQFIPMEAYEKALTDLQLPSDFIWLIKYLFTEVLDGRNAFTTPDVELVLQRKPLSFSSYVKTTAQTGIWNQAGTVS